MRPPPLRSVVFALAGALACSDEGVRLPPGGLTNSVNWAKQRGQREVTMQVAVEPHPDSFKELSEVLRTYSVAVGTWLPQPSVEILPYTLVTWHRFAVSDWLSHRPLPADSCNTLPPPTVSIGAGEIALAINAGQVMSQGVSVSVNGPYSKVAFREGAKYLLFAHECPRAAVAGMGGAGVFEVSFKQNLYPIEPSQPSGLAEAIGGLSLEALSARIKAAS